MIAARAWRDSVHWRDGEHAGRGGLLRLRRRGARPARAGPKPGARAWAARRARGHIVIDGTIDGAFIRSIMPDAAEKLERNEIQFPRTSPGTTSGSIASREAPGHSNGSAAVVGDLVMQPED